MSAVPTGPRWKGALAAVLLFLLGGVAGAAGARAWARWHGPAAERGTPAPLTAEGMAAALDLDPAARDRLTAVLDSLRDDVALAVAQGPDSLRSVARRAHARVEAVVPMDRRDRFEAWMEGHHARMMEQMGSGMTGGPDTGGGMMGPGMMRGGDSAGRQARIHAMGGSVMGFALDSTEHVFEMTPTGGVERVVARNGPGSAQVPLVRSHLRREADRFAAGDFSDPASLHGTDMPGLSELSAAAGRIEVSYRDVSGGGEVVFAAPGPELVTAIHRWFGAQLSDHGADATAR